MANNSSTGIVSSTKTYYPAGGAMREDGTRYYVLKDHLGSASVVTNQSGTIVGEDRFYPFGETRFTTGTMKTDKLFTGQREITGLGIYHYGARFYSPKLGRFLSADTIVPGYANPQNLNRYSYVTNNPLRYIDPSGHRFVEGGFEGSLKSVENKMTQKWKADNAQRRFEAELQALEPGSPACSGSNQSVVCQPASEPELEIPLNIRLEHISSDSPSLSSEIDNIISQIEFGTEAMHLLDVVKDGIQWGRPTYRQIKYAIPLAGLEWGIDAGLQLYDDRNVNLTPGDRWSRAVIRGIESGVIDYASLGVGLLTAAAVQVNVPVPFVSAGVGYVVGSYSTSAILDNFAVQQFNQRLFNWAGVGGP